MFLRKALESLKAAPVLIFSAWSGRTAAKESRTKLRDAHWPAVASVALPLPCPLSPLSPCGLSIVSVMRMCRVWNAKLQGLQGLRGLHRVHWWKGLVNSSTDPLSLKSRFIAFIHSIHWSIGPKESLEMLDDFSVKCAAHSHIFDPIHKCFGQPSVYPFLRSLGVGVLAFDAWLSLHCGAFYWRHSNPIPTSSSQFQPSITQKSPPKILELPRPSGGFKEII